MPELRIQIQTNSSENEMHLTLVDMKLMLRGFKQDHINIDAQSIRYIYHNKKCNSCFVF